MLEKWVLLGELADEFDDCAKLLPYNCVVLDDLTPADLKHITKPLVWENMAFSEAVWSKVLEFCELVI